MLVSNMDKPQDSLVEMVKDMNRVGQETVTFELLIVETVQYYI